jgi:hypothetical protein
MIGSHIFELTCSTSSVPPWVGFTAMLAFLVKFPVYTAIYLAVPKAHVEFHSPLREIFLKVN